MLEALEEAGEKLRDGDAVSAGVLADRARQRADGVISHVSIRSLENFPEMHNLFLYLPLFLPILISLVLMIQTQIGTWLDSKTDA